jgi:hypothetical protein
VPEVQAWHRPDHGTPSSLVRRAGLRNTLWFAWLRRPLWPALRWSLHVVRTSPPSRATAGGVADALRGLHWVLRERRLLPQDAERQLAALDPQKRSSRARRYGR